MRCDSREQKVAKFKHKRDELTDEKTEIVKKLKAELEKFTVSPIFSSIVDSDRVQCQFLLIKLRLLTFLESPFASHVNVI